ncbi:hypothetical protein V492_08531 [Pseudogymnoascus sp. VKM F-4246]|nr:hypothetical protein V492_08531 [Pseudogymnoascus sp. VKM F-4246]
MPDIAWNCNAWHTVVSGVDNCYSIQQEYGITAAEFLEWNPAVSSDCLTNFWPDYAYCVGVNPDATSTSSSTIPTSTSSRSGTTTSEATSVPTSQINTTTVPYSTRYPITSYNLTTTTIATAFPPAHTLGGQPSYCNRWHLVVTGDSCTTIVYEYGNRLTLDQLHEYNPTLGDDCGGLYLGWFICVGIQPQTSISLGWSTSPTDVVVPDPTSYTPPVYSTVPDFTATPQQTGIPSSCQNFYEAQAGDTCNEILNEYGYITRDQFFSWNPALAGNCDGLWGGYFYCVANFDLSNLPPPATVTVSPSPTETGTVSTCNSWYLTTGDENCDNIVESFRTFSKSDFISWNPSVWSTCENIQEGIYYCVGIPGSQTTRTAIPSTSAPVTSTGTVISTGTSTGTGTTTSGQGTTTSGPTTTSAGPVTTPSPFMPGMVSGCIRFYFRGPDAATLYCYDIAAAVGIAIDDFYGWNPQVGNDCANLWADTWYCIGTSGSATTITGGQPSAMQT